MKWLEQVSWFRRCFKWSGVVEEVRSHISDLDAAAATARREADTLRLQLEATDTTLKQMRHELKQTRAGNKTLLRFVAHTQRLAVPVEDGSARAVLTRGTNGL
jgi:septal ring factor EnvC (AmiA/AmiB activator)